MGKFLRWLVFFIFPLVVIGGAAILENLSSSKMGVNRYLLFKKTHYATTVFTPERIKLYTILLIVGLILCLFLYFKTKMGSTRRLLIYLTAYQAIGVVLLSLQNLSAYPIFGFGIAIIVILQYFLVVVVLVKNKPCK